MKAKLSLFVKTREFYLICFIVITSTILSIFSSNFFTLSNISNIFLQISGISIAAVGMTIVIITGGIDVSVGSILAFTCAIVGKLAVAGVNPVIASFVGICVGMILGMINGLFISNISIAPIIVTLGTMNLIRAIMFQVLDGKWIYSIPRGFRFIGTAKFFKFPISMWLAIILAIIFSLFLKHRRTGRHFYAIGGNKENAILCGIKVKKVEIIAYLISGFTAALAGLTYLGRTGLVQTNTGTGFELDVIAATVLGGTSVAGGKGTIIGSILGAFMVGLLKNGLILLNMPALVNGIVIGGLIIIAVAFDLNSRREG